MRWRGSEEPMRSLDLVLVLGVVTREGEWCHWSEDGGDSRRR